MSRPVLDAGPMAAVRSGLILRTFQPVHPAPEVSVFVPKPSARSLLRIVAAYLPVPIAGAVLSALWDVGASPDGGAGDMFLLGTALTPPLFLPVLLLVGAAAARGEGRGARVGAGVVALVGAAFLAGSTLNLPNDFAAAESAGSPLALSAGLAVVHIALAVALLYNALPTVVGRATTSPATA